MHGQDHRMRRVGLPGNVCCAIIRLDRAWTWTGCAGASQSPMMDWLARVSLVRPFPLLPALWRTSAKPKAILYEHHDPNGSMETPWSLPEVVAERELHAERGPGVTFDLVRHADGTNHLYLSGTTRFWMRGGWIFY